MMTGPITYIATQEYDSGLSTTTTLLQCTRGHYVYVEAEKAHHFKYNSYASPLTSFTGYRLYPENDTDNAVAFNALMSNNHTTTEVYQPLMFDEILLNIGGCFDPVLSEFTCPDDLYYAFTWSSAANEGGQSSHLDLTMDNSTIDHIYLTAQTTSDDTGTSGTCSMTVIVQCNTNSTLQVVGRTVRERIYLGGYTSFLGFRIPGQELP